MEEAISILKELYKSIGNEKWADERAKYAVLTGIGLAIDKLKDKLKEQRITNV